MQFVPKKTPPVLVKGREYVYIAKDAHLNEVAGFLCTVGCDMVTAERGGSITIEALTQSLIPSVYSVTVGRTYVVNPNLLREYGHGTAIYSKLLGAPR